MADGHELQNIGGTEVPTAAWAVGSGSVRKGLQSCLDIAWSWEGALLQGRGWRKCLPGLAPCAGSLGGQLRAQFNPGPPRSPCCGLPKVLLHWIWSHRCLCRAGAQGSVPALQSLTWRLFVLRLEEWGCFLVDVKSKLQKG